MAAAPGAWLTHTWMARMHTSVLLGVGWRRNARCGIGTYDRGARVPFRRVRLSRLGPFGQAAIWRLPSVSSVNATRKVEGMCALRVVGSRLNMFCITVSPSDVTGRAEALCSLSCKPKLRALRLAWLKPPSFKIFILTPGYTPHTS